MPTCIAHTSTNLVVQAQIPFTLVQNEIAATEQLAGRNPIVSLIGRSLADLTCIVQFDLTDIQADARGTITLDVRVISPATPRTPPQIEVQRADLTECVNCGLGILQGPIRGFVAAYVQGQRESVEQKLNAAITEKFTELLPQIPAGVEFHALLEICDTHLAIALYTGDLTSFDPTVQVVIAHVSNGNKIGKIAVKHSYRRFAAPTPGILRFHFVNGTSEWGEFVVERNNAGVIFRSGHLDRSGDQFNRDIPMSGFEGVTIKVVLWAPGVLAIPGMAGDFTFNVPHYGDVDVIATKT